MRQAHYLYREGTGNYALAMYTGGLAVECMLRAFVLRREMKEFESRHDVLRLAEESGILNVPRDRLKARGLSDEQIEVHEKALWASVNDVFILWRNNYRFASETRLLAHLKKLKLYEGRKGDPLKANALRLLGAAQRFIDNGGLQWR
jgi:hypothetical protein